MSALDFWEEYRPNAPALWFWDYTLTVAEELRQVQRRAFMPALYWQIWRSAPLMSALNYAGAGAPM